MIAFKTHQYQLHAEELSKIAHDFEERYQKCIRNLDLKTKTLVRECYKENYMINIVASYFLGPSLWSSYCLPPVLLHERTLPIQANYPWNTTDSDIGFYVAYLLQSVVLVWKLLAIVTIDSFGLAFFHHSNTLLEVIAHRMDVMWATVDPSEPEFKEQLEAEMVDVMKDHQFLLRIVNRFDQAMSNTFVVQVISSTFMLCMSSFQMVIGMQQKNHKLVVNFSIFFCTVLAQLILWCYTGNKIYWTVSSST